MLDTVEEGSINDYRIETIWAALALDATTGFEGIMAGARVTTGPDGYDMHIWHPLLTSDPEVLPDLARMARAICAESKTDKTFHIVRFERVTEQ